MKSLFRGFALTSLCLSLAACGTSKYYTLPTDPSLASETPTMIGACATQAGLESQRDDDVTAVKYDDTAMLYYRYGGNDSYQLSINIDEKRVPAQDMDKKFGAVKAKGDEIYACAQQRLHPSPPVAAAPMAPAAAPGPANSGMSFEMKTNINGMQGGDMSVSMNATPPAMGLSGSCAQAVDCYSQLSKVVCANTTGKCSFKAEISGNDEAGCRDALAQVPQILQMYHATKPAPAACKVQ